VGGPAQGTGTGIGPALRKARLVRGKTIEEASRETHIRAEYLHALERERYDLFLGDVYVRGALRSYSAYLGLDANKVLFIFNRTFGPPTGSQLPEPIDTPARTLSTGVHPHLPEALRHHPSWALLIGFAILALSVFAAAGLLSRSAATPNAALSPGTRPSIAVLPPGVTLALRAARQVRAVIITDGVRHSVLIRKEEALSYEAASRITVQLRSGGRVGMTVNGHPIGTPGVEGTPYTKTFGPRDFVTGPPKPAYLLTPSPSVSPTTSTEPTPSPSPSA